MSKVFEVAFHLGNSIQVIDDKKLKEALKNDIPNFHRLALRLIRNFQWHKYAMAFEEMSSKLKVEMEEIKKIISFLYDKKIINFCSVLPFSEENLDVDEYKTGLSKLRGVSLITQEYYENSEILLEKIIPLINERKFTLDQLSDIIGESPQVLRELLNRFRKISWLTIDLEFTKK